MASGDLKGWRSVPEICRRSPLGQTLLTTAFAAPLLQDRPSFAVHVVGFPTTSSHYMLMAALSVSGEVERACVSSWRALASDTEEARWSRRGHGRAAAEIGGAARRRRTLALQI